MNEKSEQKRYEELSPFELKNKLIAMATTDDERMMLNAGRGNPNWIAEAPRLAFFRLGFFALSEAKRVLDMPGFGGSPSAKCMAERFETFLADEKDNPGAEFLRDAFDYASSQLNIDRNRLVFELVDGILGDHYPTPDRMLSCCEKIVQAYLHLTMCQGKPPAGRFDLFATEGGTAAMAYIFNSLMENKLLHKGDTIALGTPIFTPYLEIPKLNDFRFVELDVEQDEDGRWQYPDAEIEKLADPEVKAFFLVHPSNPTSVAMHQKTLDKLADLVRTRRQDLILLTDDVYGTFVDGFTSLMAACPQNTILVYSFSKYFGATGWRLGVIGIHRENVFDSRIAELPARDRKQLNARYESVVLEPEKMKLIDRMVADSRAVALNHTAGLSTPQQVQMALFALSGLLDGKRDFAYNRLAQSIVRGRYEDLYRALGEQAPEDQHSTYYYTTIDIPELARTRYGDDFADHLVKDYEPIDFVWRLAEEKSVVLLDGGGFDAPNMSVRVSLANLPDQSYPVIGKAISELLAKYHDRWAAKQG